TRNDEHLEPGNVADVRVAQRLGRTGLVRTGELRRVEEVLLKAGTDGERTPVERNERIVQLAACLHGRRVRVGRVERDGVLVGRTLHLRDKFVLEPADDPARNRDGDL